MALLTAQTVRDVKGNVRSILKGIEGYIEPRHMLAIMGPSGCGKSTLLDTLAGRLSHTATQEGARLGAARHLLDSQAGPTLPVQADAPPPLLSDRRLLLPDPVLALQAGDIRVNGHKSRLSYGRAAYVTQDEVLIGTLTVAETIGFAAKLRLPQVRRVWGWGLRPSCTYHWCAPRSQSAGRRAHALRQPWLSWSSPYPTPPPSHRRR